MHKTLTQTQVGDSDLDRLNSGLKTDVNKKSHNQILALCNVLFTAPGIKESAPFIVLLAFTVNLSLLMIYPSSYKHVLISVVFGFLMCDMSLSECAVGLQGSENSTAQP